MQNGKSSATGGNLDVVPAAARAAATGIQTDTAEIRLSWIDPTLSVDGKNTVSHWFNFAQSNWQTPDVVVGLYSSLTNANLHTFSKTGNLRSLQEWQWTFIDFKGLVPYMLSVGEIVIAARLEKLAPPPLPTCVTSL